MGEQNDKGRPSFAPIPTLSYTIIAYNYKDMLVKHEKPPTLKEQDR